MCAVAEQWRRNFRAESSSDPKPRFSAGLSSLRSNWAFYKRFTVTKGGGYSFKFKMVVLI